MADKVDLPVASRITCQLVLWASGLRARMHEKLMLEQETTMKVRGIVVVAMLLALLAGTLWLSGCNTWHGAGKDVQNAGQSMQGD